MTFIIRPTDFGHYQFNLARNGNILLTSLQTFSTVKQCKEAIHLLKDRLNKKRSLCSTYSSIGGHYFYVYDEHRDPIAMSDIFISEPWMAHETGYKAAKSADIEDQLFQEFYLKQGIELLPTGCMNVLHSVPGFHCMVIIHFSSCAYCF